MQLVLVLGQTFSRAAKGADDLDHGIGRLQGIRTCAIQLDEDLAVLKTAFKPISQNEGQGRFANVAHSPQSCDSCTFAKAAQESSQLLLSPSEILRRCLYSRNRKLLRRRDNLSYQVADMLVHCAGGFVDSSCCFFHINNFATCCHWALDVSDIYLI